MSDRLALVHAIEEAGLPREKAEVMATAIARFVEGSVATKAEVERTEVALRADTERLRIDLKADIAAARSDMAWMQGWIVIRLSGVMVVLLGPVRSTQVAFMSENVSPRSAAVEQRV